MSTRARSIRTSIGPKWPSSRVPTFEAPPPLKLDCDPADTVASFPARVGEPTFWLRVLAVQLKTKTGTQLTLHAPLKAEDYLDAAMEALATGDVCRELLDRLPVPIYTTDANGAVTYWNRACVEFAGRVPRLGKDRWCVTWQLYTTSGERLPHNRCPMAQAIREQREIRGSVAIAMRPDGSRRAFTPYPTPLFDDDGKLKGAVNMLVDVSAEQADVLAEQAKRCRRLADATYDRKTCGVLAAMAEEFAKTAQDLKG